MTKKEWRKKRMKRRMAVIIATFLVLASLTFIIIFLIGELKKSVGVSIKDDSLYLSVNGVTRTGEKAPLVGIIMVQKSTQKGLTALELRNRYERAELLNPLLKGDDVIETGAHYAIGIDGACIEMIPLTEKAPGGENKIIVVYSPDENGELTEKEQATLNELIEELKDEYSIGDGNVIK